MNVGNEILTVQLGHYSNYIGAHWFNLQEAGFSFNPNYVPEINNDIMFREGSTGSGESTYTPRLVLVDFKRSLGHFEVPEDLKSVSETVNWENDKVENMVDLPEHTPNEYLKDVEEFKNNVIPLLKSHYDIDDTVKTWSDFSVQQLHTRSFNILREYRLDVNDSDFSCYSLGASLWNNNDFQEDFTDNIRWFVEECDNLQGFHILVDACNAFSGLSSKCLEYLKDEYDKKSIFTIPSYNYIVPDEEIPLSKHQLQYSLNLLAGMSQYIEFSDIITPVSLYTSLNLKTRSDRSYQNLSYKLENDYHTSAIIAAAIDSITMPYRTRDCYSRMNDLLKTVTYYDRSVTSVGTKFPFPMSNGDKLISVLEKWENKWFESLTPDVEIDVDNVTNQLINIRGIRNDELHKETQAGGDNPAYACKTTEEMFNLFFKFSFDFAKTNVRSFKTTLRIPPSYPRIFNKQYNLTSDPGNPWGRLAELRALSSLHCTPDTKNFLDAILSISGSRNVERFATNIGTIPTDFSEMQETIHRLLSCYNDSSYDI